MNFLALIALNGWNYISMGQKNLAKFSYVMMTKEHPSGNRLKNCLWTWTFTFKSEKIKNFWLRSPFGTKCDFHKIGRFVKKIFQIQKFFFLIEIAYVYSTLGGQEGLNHKRIFAQGKIT